MLWIAIFYVVPCLLVGIYGRNRALGFIGVFLLSLAFTPLLLLIILLVTAPSYDPAE